MKCGCSLRFPFSPPEIKSTRQLILRFSVWLSHLWFYPRWISCDCELFEHPPGSVLHLTNTISYRLQRSKTNKENDWIFFPRLCHRRGILQANRRPHICFLKFYLYSFSLQSVVTSLICHMVWVIKTIRSSIPELFFITRLLSNSFVCHTQTHWRAWWHDFLSICIVVWAIHFFFFFYSTPH